MKAGNCRFFNGTVNDCCKAAVRYKSFVDNEVRLPCIQEQQKHPQDERSMGVCEKISRITEEEQKEHDRETRIRMEFTTTAIGLCEMDSRSKGFAMGRGDTRGEIKCPKCGKHIAYRRSGFNGHIMGACETENCLQWIQ